MSTILPEYKRMTTGIERVFAPTREPGVYQEIYQHFIHFLDSDGNKVRSKLEKQIPGQIYRVINEGENFRSLHGEVEYEFPDGVTRRLVALAMNHDDMRYGLRPNKPSV